MSDSGCQQVAFADLVDYAAGALPPAEADAIEEHLFACATCSARAAEVDALGRAVRAAARSADIGGFVTDDILNQLARDGVRVRTFALTPGAIVPCAVWADDELMVLRLRGDFRDARAFTLSRRVAGQDVGHTTGQVTASAHGEILFVDPAAVIRQLPAAEVELLLVAHERGDDRVAGTYTLVHEGSRLRQHTVGGQTS